MMLRSSTQSQAITIQAPEDTVAEIGNTNPNVQRIQNSKKNTGKQYILILKLATKLHIVRQSDVG